MRSYLKKMAELKPEKIYLSHEEEEDSEKNFVIRKTLEQMVIEQQNKTDNIVNYVDVCNKIERQLKQTVKGYAY